MSPPLRERGRQHKAYVLIHYMCYPGVSGPGRSSRQQRLQTSTRAHFRKLPFGLKNRASWLLCQSKTIWLISISIRRQRIYMPEDNLSRRNTSRPEWSLWAQDGWDEAAGQCLQSLRAGLCFSISVSLFHFFLNSNQPCLSPHHHPVISTNTNPTAPAQYPPQRSADPLWKSHITLCEKQALSLGGERINLCSLCGIPDRQIPGGGRREEEEEEEGEGVFSTSVFPSVTCCLFDFVLSQDKH